MNHSADVSNFAFRAGSVSSFTAQQRTNKFLLSTPAHKIFKNELIIKSSTFVGWNASYTKNIKKNRDFISFDCGTGSRAITRNLFVYLPSNEPAKNIKLAKISFLLLWYALKITRDSGSLNLSGGSVLSDRESFIRVRGENAKFNREIGEFRFMKAKIRWKTFIGFWVLARISCNFPPLWAEELSRKEGGVNMINIVTREGKSSQNVSSLEIIVHYMHEHELLKGRKKW